MLQTGALYRMGGCISGYVRTCGTWYAKRCGWVCTLGREAVRLGVCISGCVRTCTTCYSKRCGCVCISGRDTWSRIKEKLCTSRRFTCHVPMVGCAYQDVTREAARFLADRKAGDADALHRNDPRQLLLHSRPGPLLHTQTAPIHVSRPSSNDSCYAKLEKAAFVTLNRSQRANRP